MQWHWNLNEFGDTMRETGPTSKGVYAHLVTWFKTRPGGGEWTMWNSDYPQSPHNPDRILHNGQHDIASVDYPLSDVYDSNDAHLIEYQMLLMKLTGVDGIVVDWDGRRIHPYRHQMLMTLLPWLERFDLKLIICFEEWCGYWPAGTFQTRAQEIQAAAQELRWLHENIMARPFYASVGQHKPLLVFRKEPEQWFSAQEWEQVLEQAQASAQLALIFEEGLDKDFAPVCGGKFFWVGGFDEQTRASTLDFARQRYEHFLAGRKVPNALTVGSVAPGFDDTRVWGWGEGPRIAPRYDCARLEQHWEMSIQHDVDLVQIVTWNDWNEGTHVEPSVREGFRCLEINKQFAARFKGLPHTCPDWALPLTLEIYKGRKRMQEQAQQKPQWDDQLDKARDLLLSAQYEAARELLAGLEI